MTTIHLTGYITSEGKLELILPEGLKTGRVDVILTLEEEKNYPTGAEIIAMLEATNGWWADEAITDSVAWSVELRQNEEKKRNIQW